MALTQLSLNNNNNNKNLPDNKTHLIASCFTECFLQFCFDNSMEKNSALQKVRVILVVKYISTGRVTKKG